MLRRTNFPYPPGGQDPIMVPGLQPAGVAPGFLSSLLKRAEG